MIDANAELFIWKRQQDHNLFTEILEIVEPFQKEREAILDCIKETLYYRTYIATDKEELVVAIAIATFLPKTETLHVEDFALHPRIRRKKYARKLWNDWRTLVRSEWTSVEALTIEVYLHNVEPWGKIMKVTKLLPQPINLLPLAPEIPMMLMGRKLTSPVSDILAEWQQLQRDASIILNTLREHKINEERRNQSTLVARL